MKKEVKKSYILKRSIFYFLMMIQAVLFTVIITGIESLLDHVIILLILILLFIINFIITYRSAVYYNFIDVIKK